MPDPLTAPSSVASSPESAGPDDPPFGPPTHARDLGRLGRYRVLKVLGRGGMGAVYLAYDQGLRRRVALKVMLPRFAARPDSKERFLREARAAAQVRSDHVVTIHDVGEDHGVPYIALEYLRGTPLDGYLTETGTPGINQVIRIGRETALGLAAAHARGLVHRDIKPGNLWLEAPNGRVKILDFGLARSEVDAPPPDPDTGFSATDAGTEPITQTGQTVGTPAFMSPEQARGLRVDFRSDLFSLGAVLYRLLTGRQPFQGPTKMAVLLQLVQDEPAPIRSLNPAVPEWLTNLVHQLLAKDPAARPASAEAVAAALGRPGDRQVVYLPLAIAAQPENVWEQIDDPPAEVDPPSRTKPAARPHRLVFAIVAAVAILTVGGAAILTMKAFQKPPRQTPPDDGKAVPTMTVAKPTTTTAAPPTASTTDTAVTKNVSPPGPWRSLFNGMDLTGWYSDKATEVRVETVDGQAVVHIAAATAVNSNDPFSDYHLTLEFQSPEAGGSVGFVGFHIMPRNGNGFQVALVKNIWGQPQIWNKDRGSRQPGAVRDGRIVAAPGPDPAEARARVKPAGQWNRLDLVCLGDGCLHAVNGQVVAVQADLRDQGKPVTGGRLLLKGQAGATFRGVRVRPIRAVPEEFGGPREQADGLLFNGKDLVGWDDGGKPYWSLSGGDLVGAWPAGVERKGFIHLKGPRVYQDFELSFQFKTHGRSGPPTTGYGWPAVLVHARPKADVGGAWTGARVNLGPKRYGTVRMARGEDPEPRDELDLLKGDGFTPVMIRCEGKHLRVTVGDAVVTDARFPNLPDDGVISWHFGSVSDGVTFRDVRLVELGKGSGGPK